jgi:hypothetical protein
MLMRIPARRVRMAPIVTKKRMRWRRKGAILRPFLYLVKYRKKSLL